MQVCRQFGEFSYFCKPSRYTNTLKTCQCTQGFVNLVVCKEVIFCHGAGVIASAWRAGILGSNPARDKEVGNYSYVF
jgi:hypothetical protein